MIEQFKDGQDAYLVHPIKKIITEQKWHGTAAQRQIVKLGYLKPNIEQARYLLSMLELLMEGDLFTREQVEHLLYVQRISCGEAYMNRQSNPDQATFYDIMNAPSPIGQEYVKTKQ